MRAKWIASSVLFQTTALAGTLAGVPLPFYNRGFYSRAYAAATCTPSSTSNYINDSSAIKSTTFTCTISSSSTITSPQYAYGGAMTWYQSDSSDVGYYPYFDPPTSGQPGLNISITNTAAIDVSEEQTVSALISFSASDGTNYYSQKQSDALRVISFGSNVGLDKGHSGGDGGTITIVNSGSIVSTVGNGIYAVSSGGYPYNNADGGSAGAITITDSGSVTAAGTAILAISRGGASAGGGTGGSGGAVTITISSDVDTITSTSAGGGIFAASYGGNNIYLSEKRVYGYEGELYQNYDQGGTGGNAGDVSVTLGSSTNVFSGSIITTASTSIASIWTQTGRVSGAAISAISYGGWGNMIQASGTAFDGGDGGDVYVTVYGASTTTLKTSGDHSDGIFAASYGGASVYGYGKGKAGGTAGNVAVSLTGGGTIYTAGEHSSGIVAMSLGGAGQETTKAQSTSSSGGVAGDVTVKNDFAITTKGSYSNGIVAISAGSGGGLYQWSGDDEFTWGDVSLGSNTSGNVSVYNYASIVTYGVDSHGIVAMSIGGGGGMLTSTSTLSTDSYGVLTSSTSAQTLGGSAQSADAASVLVINKGSITTYGGYSSTDTDTDSSTDIGGGIAILAQSIGGGGGNNVGKGASGNVGGKGDADGGGDGSDGSTVTVKNYATLTTYGSEAHGIVAQSIGGGGGTGRNNVGFVYAVGGTGGSGGDGGTAKVYNESDIVTYGDYASGIIIQSIGGGGGTGGSATAWSVFGGSLAIGGSGGSGGDGGDAIYEKSSSGTVTTSGDGATAVIVQSIGGGGGTGGAAKSETSALAFTMAVSIGGQGGKGGDGGTATAYAAGTIKTSGTDSTGLLVQSIGGGGGDGGTSTASALALGVPLDSSGHAFSLSITNSIGGYAGEGGDGGDAKAWVEKSGSIVTTGDGSNGLVVQSIGGGGGNGGDATASSATATIASIMAKLSGDWAEIKEATADKTFTLKVDSTVGGTGGDGGTGGYAYAHNKGYIYTGGNFATGMLVQSIGGGGGTGGSGESDTIGFFEDSSVAISVNLGGGAGSGGDGGTAKAGVADSGILVTKGNNSNALVVQSIGGGGGVGGAGGGDIEADTTVTISAGATGGDGGYGGKAYAWNNGKIVTSGDASSGVVVQSLGGGGGIGGSGTSSVSHSNSIDAELKKFENYHIALVYAGTVETKLSGTAAASGGDGGNGGLVVFGTRVKGTSDYSYGSITTSGALSHGVVAQSIGAGGGTVSLSSNQTTTENVLVNSITVDASITLGSSSSKTGGTGGDVYAYVSNIYTSGFSSIGVIAQSIGGGGGVGVMSGYAPTSLAVTLGSTESEADESYGGSVHVTLLKSETITTKGDNSSGVIGQSIGAGGGLAISALGTSATENDDTIADVISVTLGSSSHQSNSDTLNGATVDVTSYGAITTYGTRAFGIVAQSIGGGGGMLSASSTSIASVSFETSQHRASSDDVTVTLKDGGSISTSGDGAAGIIAQSVAGGGGFAADLSSGRLYAYYVSNSDSSYSYAGGDTNGTSGTVTVSVDDGASISTTGDYADGIIAQSIAGSGGIFQKNGKTYAGSLHRNSSSNADASIAITIDGTVKVKSDNSWAVWAQTQDGAISVTIGSTGVISGSTTSSETGGAIYAAHDTGGTLTLDNSGTISGNIVTNVAGTVTSADNYDATTVADGVVSLSTTAASGSSLLINRGVATLITGSIVGLDTVLNSGIINLGGEGNVIQTVFSGDLVGIGSSDYGSTYDAETLGLEAAFTAFTYNSRSTVKNWSTATSSSGGLISGLDVDMEGGTGDTLVVEGDFAG
ncbi:autotransporter outer membrane beta-barrel domain-containing protein, partial [Martelella alba]